MKELGSFLKIFLVSILGWTGIQKFIERKYLLGTLFLFSLGLFYVGWVLDIFKTYHSEQKKMQ